MKLLSGFILRSNISCANEHCVNMKPSNLFNINMNIISINLYFYVSSVLITLLDYDISSHNCYKTKTKPVSNA